MGAADRGLPLIVVPLEEEGLGVSSVVRFTNRAACSACGTIKRHYFDQMAVDPSGAPSWSDDASDETAPVEPVEPPAPVAAEGEARRGLFGR